MTGIEVTAIEIAITIFMARTSFAVPKYEVTLNKSVAHQPIMKAGMVEPKTKADVIFMSSLLKLV